MTIRSLHKIFAPSSVVVVGASPRRLSVGETVLRNLTSRSFGGTVVAVNPKHREINGTLCYGSVAQIPAPVDLAVICTPSASVPDVVRECGQAGIQGIVIISAGFRETGAEGARLEADILNVQREFAGMRIVGPNCLGIIAPHQGLNASFASDSPPRGSVAFISQSGALCTSILDWAIQEDVGFSHFVSAGNMLDVGIADLIDYFATDGVTQSIILYVESISEARKFMSAARAFTKTKPIIAYKAGRFSESAKAATSHTGALAGVDSVYEAALARAGIVRVFEVDDLFDCAELLSRHKVPTGPRLAIVTNAGGPGVMATDCLLERHGKLADLSAATLDQLERQLPAAWSHGNPVDVLGDAPPERFEAAVAAVLADRQVDGVLAILTPQAMTEPTAAAQAIARVAKRSSKPLLAAWMGGQKVAEAIQLLNREGVATYSTPEKAVRAFMHLVSYGRNRETLYETPRALPVGLPQDRSQIARILETARREGQPVLSETTSKLLLEAYDIPVSKTFVARTADEACAHAQHVGFPVALKIFSPDITHKSDVGGVELNLASEAEVAQSFERIRCRARERRPDARIEGVTVQHMVVDPNGRELIVGAKRDPVFGAVLLVGAGGVTAELFRDRAVELPPLNERLARRMLESLQSWPLLTGYRGKPAVNIDRLLEVLMRLSFLVADSPEILELDINPLLVTPADVIALDARMVVELSPDIQPVRPYAHLAIRPYPEEFVKPAKLANGMPVLLRPIKPEDETMWHALVASCSPETLRRRFRYMFKATTHEMATRFCFIDYDRELAIVAEREIDGRPTLMGVARLVADADHRDAEYAVLVGDPWHGQGIGSLLTDYCLAICTQWGIRTVTAEVATDNERMLGMFRRRDFQLKRSLDSDTVVVTRHLPAEVGVSSVSAMS